MGKENTNLVNNYGELKALERELLIAQRDLKLVKSGARRRKLREYIDDLRIEMGWTLLDMGNYEKGLALFESLSWSNYGEAKCNGIGRALTEMGHYDEARKILQLGLKKFPKSYALWVAMGGCAIPLEIILEHWNVLRRLSSLLQRIILQAFIIRLWR